MKYSIYYATGAYKYLQKLQPQIARKIYLSMNNIANDNTIGKDINKLAGFEQTYRLRIGKYRVVYEKHEEILLIRVIEIKSRGDVYKNL